MSAEIRLASDTDAAAVAEIYSPVVAATATSFELVPPDAAEMANRIRNTIVRTPWIVCTNGSEVLGYAYASSFRPRPAYQWTVEVSAYARSDRQRSGVGRALYTSLFEVLRLQGFRNALAVITLPNAASEGLHRALGFTTIGTLHNVGYKLGAWHDVAWMEMRLVEPIADPPVPVPLESIRETPALHLALKAGLHHVRHPG